MQMYTFCVFLLPFWKLRRKKNDRYRISPLRYWIKDCTAWKCIASSLLYTNLSIKILFTRVQIIRHQQTMRLLGLCRYVARCLALEVHFSELHRSVRYGGVGCNTLKGS